MEASSYQEELTLVGEVVAIFFESPSNFYKVLRVELDPDAHADALEDEITMTGNFASLHMGTIYEFTGHMVNHPRFGEQFSVIRYQQKAPTSDEGLIDYLSSPRFRGIGPVLAKRIVERLGDNVIDQIIHDPDVLKGIQGLSDKVRQGLHTCLMDHQGAERIFLRLNEWGFSPRLSDAIYQVYENRTLHKLQENPYELIEKVNGISFSRADQLAEQLGFEELSPERLQAALYTATMNESFNQGSTYVLRHDLLLEARNLLETSRRIIIEDEVLEAALDRTVLQERLMKLHEGIMLPSLYYAEVGIALNIDDFLQDEELITFEDEEVEAAIDQVVQQTGKTYDAQQREALKLAIHSPMSIITGGPGTGKTTLVEGLIHLYALLNDLDVEEMATGDGSQEIRLAAPTGRAAKRMNELAKIPATTIHRLIGYHRDSDLNNFIPEEISGQLLIVDEMSMVDTWLMNWLTQAIPQGMQVVFVGDRDQLPSVSPGKVFNDLIESEVIATIQLEKIYRQAQDSSIVHLAHTIRHKQLPENFLQKQSDRSFVQAPGGQITHVVQQIVTHALSQGYTAETLQVLAPMYQGVAGINALNDLIQEIMNPPSDNKHEIKHFETIFRVGDKVLQNVNNADENIYNGDIGFITAVVSKGTSGATSDEVVVEFDEGQEITYQRQDLDQLTLAYCTSIHKAQGSEYPLVILPMVQMYSRMLRRDLLYTAVTRASDKLVLLGDPASFVKAVESDTDVRHTFLKDLLKVQVEDRDWEELHQKPSEESPVLEETNSIRSQAVAIIKAQEAEQQEEIPTVTFDELTLENCHLVDPMIGMEGISPQDFM